MSDTLRSQGKVPCSSLSSTHLFQQALKRAYVLNNQKKELGFYWLSAAQVLTQISSETAEVQQALHHQESPERVAEEIGDLLHAVIELCLFLDLTPEEILENALNKFEKRFNMMKQLMDNCGLKSLRDKSPEAMALWRETKKMVPPERIELSTSPLPRVCSATELRRPTDARCIRSFSKIQDSKMVDLKKNSKSVPKTATKPDSEINANPPSKKNTKTQIDSKIKRRAQALRDNLKKRKLQQKTRAESKADPL